MQFTDGIFDVSAKHGFLPINPPNKRLPDQFVQLQTIVDQLPQCVIKDELLEQLLQDLPIYDISPIEDKFVQQSLFSAYAFISSFYLLEPSYRELLVTGNYGQGRSLLPKVLSKPFCAVAKKLDTYPYLDFILPNSKKGLTTKGFKTTDAEVILKWTWNYNESAP